MKDQKKPASPDELKQTLEAFGEKYFKTERDAPRETTDYRKIPVEEYDNQENHNLHDYNK